jgi:hypothetical protein
MSRQCKLHALMYLSLNPVLSLPIWIWFRDWGVEKHEGQIIPNRHHLRLAVFNGTGEDGNLFCPIDGES